MTLSGSLCGHPTSLLDSSAQPRPTVAFLLPSDMFELIYGQECTEAIAAQARVITPHPLGPAQLSSLAPGALADVEAVFTGWNSPLFDEPMLQQLPRLRTVFHGAGSIRPYVTDAFWRRNISITTAAIANAIPVAEYTLGAILLSLKQAWRLSRQTRETRAFPNSLPAVKGACGATIGLVSLGLIGQEVLKRLRSFDVEVIVYDPYLTAARSAEFEVESVSMVELMARSDVISLHSPLNTETQGFITGDLLAHLKPGATFINTARGAIVNEPELIAFLRNRPDVQAILDVTSPEPPPADSPLYDLPNVFLTPHIAGSLGQECRRMGWTMVEEFERYQRGEPLQYPLSRERALQQT